VPYNLENVIRRLTCLIKAKMNFYCSSISGSLFARVIYRNALKEEQQRIVAAPFETVTELE